MDSHSSRPLHRALEHDEAATLSPLPPPLPPGGIESRDLQQQLVPHPRHIIPAHGPAASHASLPFGWHEAFVTRMPSHLQGSRVHTYRKRTIERRLDTVAHLPPQTNASHLLVHAPEPEARKRHIDSRLEHVRERRDDVVDARHIQDRLQYGSGTH
jgi:hypothetical protein